MRFPPPRVCARCTWPCLHCPEGLRRGAGAPKVFSNVGRAGWDRDPLGWTTFDAWQVPERSVRKAQCLWYVGVRLDRKASGEFAYRVKSWMSRPCPAMSGILRPSTPARASGNFFGIPELLHGARALWRQSQHPRSAFGAGAKGTRPIKKGAGATGYGGTLPAAFPLDPRRRAVRFCSWAFGPLKVRGLQRRIDRERWGGRFPVARQYDVVQC